MPITKHCTCYICDKPVTEIKHVFSHIEHNLAILAEVSIDYREDYICRECVVMLVTKGAIRNEQIHSD